MIKIGITRSKIDKDLVVTKNGQQYLNCILFKNPEGPDQYGNDGVIKQEATKEERERRQKLGLKIPIIGNWRYMKDAAPQRQADQRPSGAPKPNEDDDVPF